jgi:hypothetical protein
MAGRMSWLTLVMGAWLSLPAALPGWASEPPAPLPDKALVYFARSGRMSGAAGSIYLFADQTFVGILHNGTYGYAHLAPGRRLFWTTWTKATREIDLVPGETYYLEVWREVAVLDAGRGQALIQKVKDLAVPDEGEQRKARTYIAKRYESALDKEGLREKAPEPVIEVPQAVATDLEADMKIPAYTQGLLEFMESVTSEFSPVGSSVLFRLVNDVVVEGQVVARAGKLVNGIVRQSSQAGGFGKGGSMEVSVPSLQAEDGALVPLAAQVVGAGSDTQDAAAGVGALFGLFGGLAVRGREAYYLAGERLKVWTREDAWVHRTEPSHPADVAAEPADPAASLVAHGPEVVRFVPRKGYKPSDFEVVLETDARPAEVTVTGVADLVLPAPLPSKECARRKDGWHCSFDGWGLIRYLRIGHETDPQSITLGGRLDDGRVFTATVGVLYKVER